MAEIAKKRGVKVCEAYAEELPFVHGSFDFVLMVPCPQRLYQVLS
jgi:ubiquinone/menaquinone biosynthesis C-methylase UbiE